MQTIPAPLLAHSKLEVTTIAVCWLVERSDGITIRGTQHDRDITITVGALAGVYQAGAGISGSDIKSSSDMSSNNMEVNGSLRAEADLTVIDLSALEIEAGMFDDASVMTFSLNWAAPDDGQRVIRVGNLGEISRTSEGAYRTELRGLTQRLTQVIGRTYSPSCDAEFGDARCGLDVDALEITGSVTTVYSNRRFTASLVDGSPPSENGDFNGGVITWNSGDNESFGMEVKSDCVGATLGEMLLYLPMPRDIQVGDTFTLRPGCDLTPAMCKTKYDNLNNFRGHGAWVPGVGEVLAFGGQTSEKKPRNPDFFDLHDIPLIPFFGP
jgi:uncharacterized phage protein (TIGR02218 family)